MDSGVCFSHFLVITFFKAQVGAIADFCLVIGLMLALIVFLYSDCFPSYRWFGQLSVMGFLGQSIVLSDYQAAL